MIWRQRVSLALLTLLLGALAGCMGHSEEEWQAKLKENLDLQNQLTATRQKADSDLKSASDQIEGLKGQLKRAGVDVSNLTADLAEQKAATSPCAKTR